MPAAQSTRGVSPAVASIEDAFETHWRLFGLYPGASLYEEQGILRYESPIAHLPYNAVIRTFIDDGADADALIDGVAAGYRGRSVPFMWVHRPSDRPGDLPSRLARSSLDLVEQAIGMDLDLAAWQPQPVATAATIVEAADDRQMADYEEMIRTYWSVPADARAMIRTLNHHWTGERSQGARFVAYLEDQPVAKLFLNLRDLPVRCAVYGVSVLPEARGRGLATAMMSVALNRAKEAGALSAVLHSSRMALQLYRRMGFVERCQFNVYATGPIFGTHHH